MNLSEPPPAAPVPALGSCSLELPRQESSVYTWDLHIPTISKLVEEFHQPNAPLRVSQIIKFDTGVLQRVMHHWILTVDIAKMGLEFFLPYTGDNKYKVDHLRLDFFEESRKKFSFAPSVVFHHDIQNQRAPYVESELHFTHPVWSQNIDTIRINWTIKATIGKISLTKVQYLDIDEDEEEEEGNNKIFDFSDLFRLKHLSDLVIICQGERIHAHRAILCGRSPVFAAMFQHGMKENEEKLLTIEDISSPIVKEMLRYIYTGEVHRLEDIAPQLLPVSEKYQLSGLKRACEISLGNNMTLESAVELYSLGDLYGANLLKKKCLELLSRSRPYIAQDRDKMKEINKKHPDITFDLIFGNF